MPVSHFEADYRTLHLQQSGIRLSRRIGDEANPGIVEPRPGERHCRRDVGVLRIGGRRLPGTPLEEESWLIHRFEIERIFGRRAAPGPWRLGEVKTIRFSPARRCAARTPQRTKS